MGAENQEQVRRVIDALLARPALAVQVIRNLGPLVFASPWVGSEEDGAFHRTLEWGQTGVQILATVHLKEITPRSLSFDERWVTQVFDPLRGGPPKTDEFESMQQAMDEADSLLEGMGVILINEDDDG